MAWTRWNRPAGFYGCPGSGTGHEPNPRGFRPGSVRNDTFFRAIPVVLQLRPKTIFVCAIQGCPQAELWVKKLNIEYAVRVLPTVPHDQMADLFRLS
jgi:hypothetical protein